MESPSLWWSTAIWEITAHQSIDSDCGVHLSMPRHGGKSNRCPRGETAERGKGTKALHSSATHRQCKQREHVPMEQSKATQQSPLHLLLRAAGFKPCPLPGLRLLSCRSRAEKSLTSVHRRNHSTYRLSQSSLWVCTSPSPPLPILVSPSHPAVLPASFNGRTSPGARSLSYLTIALQQYTSVAKPHWQRRMCPEGVQRFV